MKKWIVRIPWNEFGCFINYETKLFIATLSPIHQENILSDLADKYNYSYDKFCKSNLTISFCNESHFESFMTVCRFVHHRLPDRFVIKIKEMKAR